MSFQPNDLCAQLAGFDLRQGPPLRSTPLDQVDFHDFLEAASRHRLIGLALHAVERGAFAVNSQQRLELEHMQRFILERCLGLDRELLRIVEILRRSGIEPRVIKGVAHATLLYHDPSLRCYGDIDLLVTGDQIDEVVSTLLEHGVTRPKPELRPGYDRRFGKGVTMRSSERYGVDVHRTFAAGPYALLIDADSLFTETTTFTLGGQEITAFGPTLRLLNACFNAAISDARPTLISQRDVVSAALSVDLDWTRAIELAREWTAAGVLATAVTDAWDSLRPDAESPLLDWARSYVPERREQRFIAAYAGGDQRWAREAFAAFPVVRGPRLKLAYLRAVLMPTKEAAHRRQRRRGTRLLDAARLLGRRARSSGSGPVG